MNWLSDNVNQLALLGAAAILILTIGVAAKYFKQMKEGKSEGVLKEENWDGIGEYKNNSPIGWSLAFIGTIIWGVWYWFIGYPLNAYSQIGEYNEEVAAHAAKFESKWANPTKEDLLGMGEGVFLVQCSPCHGIDGTGIEGKAQDLTRRLLKKEVLDVINRGSAALGNPNGQFGYQLGMMPPGLLSGADAEAVAEYVANGFKGNDKGAELFQTACASCHGPDGKGMNGMAPNLREYDDTIISKVLENGKHGIIGKMPSFKGRLTPVQQKAVATYIRSLSEGA
ncbi:cytochrome c oxidase cbb3-type subunit III [Nitratiruptor sp. YY08-26]|uniref:c-type cytochrome n=1 Tax=unclassified Nitratiruptor TaxID=2624044 RepID=UPI001916BC2A|nr:MULTISPECIES: c-type cytochrome [unclassified Nitratiruptor]BCD62941.1 cytochrome c oxidase cbb3-type subunit III [Nitratiruptor sp. YY08-13]BCD66876.1 cytochrome c oxidase cbb3-type subunit III [Nitratiruptor sp. YY08-26]